MGEDDTMYAADAWKMALTIDCSCSPCFLSTLTIINAPHPSIMAYLKTSWYITCVLIDLFWLNAMNCSDIPFTRVNGAQNLLTLISTQTFDDINFVPNKTGVGRYGLCIQILEIPEAKATSPHVQCCSLLTLLITLPLFFFFLSIFFFLFSI